jgi:hypothetical protein
VMSWKSARRSPLKTAFVMGESVPDTAALIVDGRERAKLKQMIMKHITLLSDSSSHLVSESRIRGSECVTHLDIIEVQSG